MSTLEKAACWGPAGDTEEVTGTASDGSFWKSGEVKSPIAKSSLVKNKGCIFYCLTYSKTSSEKIPKVDVAPHLHG